MPTTTLVFAARTAWRNVQVVAEAALSTKSFTWMIADEAECAASVKPAATSTRGQRSLGCRLPVRVASAELSYLNAVLAPLPSDVKVQVEFNPKRVTSYRQIGYAKHQLKKEQFRDNTVDAAELAAAESGNALYVLHSDPNGNGPIGTVRVRYREPETGLDREREWPVPYAGAAIPLERAPATLRLAATASAFS